LAHAGSHGVEVAVGGGGGGGDDAGGVVGFVVGGARVCEGVVLRLASSSAAMSAAEGEDGAAGEGLAIVWVGRPEREREVLLPGRWAAAAG
jgi:hypothetical protein